MKVLLPQPIFGPIGKSFLYIQVLSMMVNLLVVSKFGYRDMKNY